LTPTEANRLHAALGATLCVFAFAAGVFAQETTALSFEVAVVHVEPTTQVVFKQSAPVRFTPTLTPSGFQIRWASSRIIVPFAERKYDDPFVAAVRFSGDTASIELREPNLSARAYPLGNPDRVVVEIGRPAATPAQQPAAPAAAALPALTIVIDAGHGGTETGAIGPGGLQEKEATLAIARRLAGALSHNLSARVLQTRDSDSVISLDDRTALANHEKADLFLSIHANSSRANNAHGSETYYLSLEASDKIAQEVANQENQALAPVASVPGTTGARDPSLDFILWDLAQSAHLKESSELAEAIQEELNALSGTQNRGIKQAPFRVLVGATMPAVLVETAFISNAEEEKKLGNPAFQQSVAEGIAKAVGRFFARHKPGSPRPTPAPPPQPPVAR
jgi:N-acetylmuramoyl-L-alanine amidase